MAADKTPECSVIEEYVKELAPGIADVDCGKVFGTKDYLVWLQLHPDSRADNLVITMEAYQDDRWKPKIMAKLEEMNS